MARRRIRSAAPLAALAADGTRPAAEQARPVSGFASPHADASDRWSRLRWDWIWQSAWRCVGRARTEFRTPADVAHDIAAEVIRLLEAGIPERTAYRRAEGIAAALVLDDDVCGLLGESHALRRIRMQNGTIEGAADPDAAPPARSSGRRLTRGDWRALETFLRRVLPDASGRRRSQPRAILHGLWLEGESLQLLADRSGLTLARAQQLRSAGLAACEAALGRRARGHYDRRRAA